MVDSVAVGETEVLVGVGCGRRCGLGQTTSTVPQTMLTATNKLSAQNRVALLRPFCERVTTYLPMLIFLHRLLDPAKPVEHTGQSPRLSPTKDEPFRNR